MALKSNPLFRTDRLALLVCGALPAFLLPGCYSTKSANGSIDLSDVPDKVALVETLELPLADFGTRATGSETSIIFDLKNTGPYPASELGPDPESQPLAAPFSFKGGTWPGTGGTCGTSLESGESCKIVLSFSPLSKGSFQADLHLSYVNGIIVAPLAIALRGATPAELGFTVDSIFDFGTIQTAHSSFRQLTVRNDGGRAATLKISTFSPPPATPGAPVPFSYYNGGVFPGTGGTCSLATPLPPGGSCTLQLAFTPLTAGSYAGFLITIGYANGATGATSDSALEHALSGIAN